MYTHRHSETHAELACICMYVCVRVDCRIHSIYIYALYVLVLVPAIDHDLEYGEEVATVSVSCA